MGCKRLVSSPIASVMSLGSIQLSLGGYMGSFFPGLKRPRREGESLHLSSAEIRNAWSCISAIPYVLVAWWSIKQWQLQIRCGILNSTDSTGALGNRC
jgi:hypothetical protein